MIRSIRSLFARMRLMQIPLRVVCGLFFLNLLANVLEGLGIAILLPVLQILNAGDAEKAAANGAAYWKYMNLIAEAVGVRITLGLLLSVSFTLLLIRQAIKYVDVAVENRVRRRLADRIRQRAFSSYLRANTTLQDQTRIGDIANDLITELGRALGALFTTIQTAGKVVQMALYLFGLFMLSAPMTLLSIAIVGVVTFLSRNMLVAVKHAGKEITQSSSRLTSFIVERLRHTRLIRLSGTEKAEAKAFARLSRAHSLRQTEQKMLIARISLLPEPVALGFAYLVIFIGGTQLGMSLDRLGMFVVVLVRLLPIARGIMADYNNIMSRWPSVEKVCGSLQLIESSREPRGGDRVFATLERAVVYDNVKFTYSNASGPALDGVTVSLPAHGMTALVGPSGAGKSTFVDLLPRIWAPSAGEIRFDGIPISEFTLESLRAGIAFVPQHPQIFDISAAEHIRYGKEDASDEEVREAARLAGALSFLEALPDGLDTLLNDGGKRLSGGQRQRLDIARALVRRAPILILDEPTSALDADAEAAFRDALQSLRRNTDLTIIVIAHRLSTIVDADQIVVLDCGRVEAAGDHATLIAGDNWYSRAVRKQFVVPGDRPIGAEAHRATVGL